jgi:competence protein ComEA
MLVALFALVALARSGLHEENGRRPEMTSRADADAALPGSRDASVRVVQAEPDAGVPESPGARALREGRPMDLNAATASDLELLPRIGPALAARIVEHRERRGPFRRVGALARVRGIGPRTVRGLRHLVTVEAPRQ